MYDITNEESFNAVQDWATQIRTYSWDGAQMLLVGNKADLEDDRVISKQRGHDLASQMGCQFLETSSKSNVNVNESFLRLVDSVCQKMSEEEGTDPNRHHETQDLHETIKGQNQSSNCPC